MGTREKAKTLERLKGHSHWGPWERDNISSASMSFCDSVVLSLYFFHSTFDQKNSLNFLVIPIPYAKRI
jgi:hypothetical protein